jgi:hypothetical protein
MLFFHFFLAHSRYLPENSITSISILSYHQLLYPLIPDHQTSSNIIKHNHK